MKSVLLFVFFFSSRRRHTRFTSDWSSDVCSSDLKIAIFNQDGYHALDGICVHQDNPIAAGKLDGDIVECPSHFWHYNIKTGELQDYLNGVKLQTYPVEERNDGIYIDLQ